MADTSEGADMPDVTPHPLCAAPLIRGANKGSPATGTCAGAARHRRAGEDLCGACRAAVRERDRRFYANNPAPAKERARRRRAEQPEAARAYEAAWQRANAARMREHRRRWSEANAEAVRANQQRMRAKRRGASTVPFTAEQLDARLSMFGFRCWMCRGPFEHVDHVKPVSAGGMHCLSNLRPACRPCNQSKSGQWPYALHAGASAHE